MKHWNEKVMRLMTENTYRMSKESVTQVSRNYRYIYNIYIFIYLLYYIITHTHTKV